MKCLCKKGLVFFILFLYALATTATLDPVYNSSGTWAGIEVIGTDIQTAKKLKNLIPINIGDSFSSTKEQIKFWCNPIKKEMIDHEVLCSVLALSSGEKYYIIEIASKKKSQKTLKIIPPAPIGIDTSLPEQLVQILNDFYDRWNTLMAKNTPCKETREKGYFDYSDPILHELVQKLIILVPTYSKQLFNVLSYSKIDDDRADAAHLLSWANNPNTLKKALELDLLKDPYEGVRNNAARSMLAFIDRVEDKQVIAQAVNAFCEQAQLVSFTDKNKAFYNLEIIFEKYPQTRSLPNAACIQTINNDAQQSILNNLGGIAKRIQSLLLLREQHVSLLLKYSPF